MTRRWFRCWAIVRITGLWPSTLYGDACLRPSLASCPFCNAANIEVDHPLCTCIGFASAFLELSDVGLLPPRAHVSELMRVLLGASAPADQLFRHIGFVGSCLHSVLSAVYHCPVSDDLDLALLVDAPGAALDSELATLLTVDASLVD